MADVREWQAWKACTRLLGLGLAVAVLLPLVGCAATQPSGFCSDDSAQCIARRKQHFQAMTADDTHAWVRRRPSVAEYGSGVRLFAYRNRMSDMPCDLLNRGVAETSQARSVLTPGATGTMSADRRGQIIALADDVNAELTAERRSRCSG